MDLAYAKIDDEGNALWQRLENKAAQIRKDGYTAVWLPPAGLAAGGLDVVGYGIKNWYELDGTKYGSAVELKSACLKLRDEGLQIYHDQVHNHLMGGEDETDVWCRHVKKQNKNECAHPECQWFHANIPTRFPWLGMPAATLTPIILMRRIAGYSVEKPLNVRPISIHGVAAIWISTVWDVVKKLEAFGYWYKYNVHVDGYRFDA